MNSPKLRIGKIPYTNLFPIFFSLQRHCECSSYEFVEGPPSTLNRMLREGLLDISPSSSIEYLKNPDIYEIVSGHSISADGPVLSILFFSRKPIEKLEGSEIAVSSQSETSVALLDIVLRRFYCLKKISLISSDRPELSGKEAFLLIGDDALKAGSSCITNKDLIVYDLGKIWNEHTGLPFVFALWIARKESVKQAHYPDFLRSLDEAKTKAFEDLEAIAEASTAKLFMPQQDIVAYWKIIDYGFDSKHLAGLELFKKYLIELGGLTH
ncbi:MAG: menaquinone biosynthesis protein [Nitrospirae bacterium]|nr:menaquinone biosynthesis protein [Nitrospirota bacterium]